MLYKTGFVSISPTVAEWQATQKCVTDRHKIFPLTAIAPILNEGWGQQDNPEFQPYFQSRTELSVYQDCLFWGSRVVIPPKYREDISELHSTHPGIVKMKLLSRSYVWWPKLDNGIETVVKSCMTCQEISNKPAVAQLCPWNFPQQPWSRLHIDYAGLIENKMILVIVDSTSKWIEAHVVNNSTSKVIIEKLRQTFSSQGIPHSIVSDNGTCFTSSKFSDFCVHNGIKHIRVSPFHLASNGLAERAVQTIKLGIRKINGGSLESRLYKFLLQYHVTPQATTKEAPCVLLNKRLLRTRLDLVKPDIVENVQESQSKMKIKHDVHAKERNLCVGDPVFCLNFGVGPKWLPGVIEERLSFHFFPHTDG